MLQILEVNAFLEGLLLLSFKIGKLNFPLLLGLELVPSVLFCVCLLPFHVRSQGQFLVKCHPLCLFEILCLDTLVFLVCQLIFVLLT